MLCFCESPTRIKRSSNLHLIQLEKLQVSDTTWLIVKKCTFVWTAESVETLTQVEPCSFMCRTAPTRKRESRSKNFERLSVYICVCVCVYEHMRVCALLYEPG